MPEARSSRRRRRGSWIAELQVRELIERYDDVRASAEDGLAVAAGQLVVNPRRLVPIQTEVQHRRGRDRSGGADHGSRPVRAAQRRRAAQRVPRGGVQRAHLLRKRRIMMHASFTELHHTQVETERPIKPAVANADHFRTAAPDVHDDGVRHRTIAGRQAGADPQPGAAGFLFA